MLNSLRYVRSVIIRTICGVILLFAVSTARQFSSLWKEQYHTRQPITTSSSTKPVVKYAVHSRGQMRLAIANNGTFGTYGQDIVDPYTGERIESCEYPKNSHIVYLWVGAFWIGAMVGRDTLVSTGTEDFYESAEFWPEVEPLGDFKIESIDAASPFYDHNAYSEEDVICEYTDTLTDPSLVNPDYGSTRPHRPLNIKVNQRSMAWSYSYADDFILFDYSIQNIGKDRLKDVYMGIWVDGDVWHTSRYGPEGWNDDIVGFYRTHPAPEGCGFVDTVNVAYTADNDGDPDAGRWDYRSPRNVVGARVVRTPSDSLDISFNWWIINYGEPAADFGPRLIPTADDPYWEFADGRKGTPARDVDKYYIMKHREFDYDLLFTDVDHQREGFEPRPVDAETYARGYDTRFLLSFGPFTIDPGQKLPISFAWVGGTDLHKGPNDYRDLFVDPEQPDAYYNSLDFSNLALNSRWASWVYDNPGVDTDNDGYAGKFRVCVYDSVPAGMEKVVSGADTTYKTTYRYTVADTFYYEGDGVPDFKGAGPPPAPFMRVIPALGKLIIRWNGFLSETTKDVFLNAVDFEGYRVYLGLDDRLGSLTLRSSYDIEDYNRFVLRTLPTGEQAWVLEDSPFTLEQLRAEYNDSRFDPLAYTRGRPLILEGHAYYFEPQDFNASDLSDPRGIHKVYPDAVNPGADTSLWQDDDLVFDYDRPLPKYYEYELVIDNILPTVPYYASVTAFDFGSPGAGLLALETDPLNNIVQEYPQPAWDSVQANDFEVYVYPNPYRIDGNYYEKGFEGRDVAYPVPDRMRRIHFANLPPRCTISVFTLDGDLVRRLEHDRDPGEPMASHDSWDLISRNTQAVVSGIYYWTVEQPDGSTQIGKLVIIK